MTQLALRPVTATFGVEITGVELADGVDDDLLAALRTAVHEHQVVFLPDQGRLGDEGQLDLMLRLGTPYIHPIGRAAGLTEATVEHIVDDADHPPFQDRWHTDVSWDTTPPALGSLRAIEMPEQGGDTLWASMYAAWDGLSNELQSRLRGLECRHDLGDGEAFKSKGGEELYEQAMAMYPDTRHPLAAVHPVTGRSYLYANRQFTSEIVGLEPAESAALLRFLTDHAVQPHYCLRRRWSVGDLCIWDERATQHFAMADHFPARREMARVAVGDPAPT